jgi:hypothetical protein
MVWNTKSVLCPTDCIRCCGKVFTESLPRDVRGWTQTYREHGDLISLLLFLQNKEIKL